MRPIDADKIKKEIFSVYENEFPTATGGFDEFATRIIPSIINNAPTVEADRPKGKWEAVWVKHNACNVLIGYACSNCGEVETVFDYNFCHNCGADMRGEDE